MKKEIKLSHFPNKFGKMRMRIKPVFVIIFLALLVFSFVSAESYRSYKVAYTTTGTSGLTGTSIDKEACKAGQDFIIQIAPGGCVSVPVRSDLLEEQDVPVYCQLMAIKMNPMIKVEAIEDMTFKNQPKSIKGIGFYTAKGA